MWIYWKIWQWKIHYLNYEMKNCWWKQKGQKKNVWLLPKLSIQISIINAKWFTVKSIWFCIKLPLSSMFKWTFSIYFLKPILNHVSFLNTNHPLFQYLYNSYCCSKRKKVKIKNKNRKRKLFIHFLSSTLNINNKRISERNYKKFLKYKKKIINFN